MITPLRETRDWRSVVLLIGLLIVLLIAIGSVSGCVGTASTDRIGSWRAVFRADGTALIERGERIHATVTAPAKADGPTTQAIGTGGDVVTSIAGNFAPPTIPLAAYGLKIQAWVFYGGAALVALLAVVAWFMGQRALGLGLSGLAGALSLAPTFINSYGVYIIGAGLVALLAAGAWSFRGWWMSRQEHQAAVDSAAKLTKDGKPLEAIAALRESPKVRPAWSK